MSRRPTIVDVARAAGVSKSTVSLVLQNSPLVKADTRDQVRKAMADLGYVYNRAAAKLRRSNAGLIGLVINDLRNPFFSEFATAVQMALSARGYVTVVANTDDDPALQAQVVSAMIEHGVSALVICPAYGGQQDTFDAIRRSGLPCLQVLRRVAPPGSGIPLCAPDFRGGTWSAVDHLVWQGARRIAFLGGIEGRPITEERLSCYLERLEIAGMEPLFLPGRASRKFGHDIACTLAKTHGDVDAVMCFNDLIGLGVLSGCAQAGRQVGRDLLVVGFDDIDECAHAFPGLSSVRTFISDFGAGIAGSVLAWLEKDQKPEPETRTPVDLIVRASSRMAGCRPLQD
ncbi:LacI family DNA-binding transcriptional regulator [Meridianimarinicoccus sp. MJW13]|uniref:LacI family DNA-binding transcriptional regulator n=1 Tax=Meridianimarinicoccus sp. MJW13 TaxID=2720031 RepID=UPI00186964A0|nr:LacI family DNA-binding transcriptional regulator [Fluviibacterium sp. MJW13]